MESILTSILARNKAFSNETALVQVIYINRTASHINSACSTKGTEILKKNSSGPKKKEYFRMSSYESKCSQSYLNGHLLNVFSAF